MTRRADSCTSFLSLRAPRFNNVLDKPAPPTIPFVTTNAASGVTGTQATGNGSVDNDGGSVITERGFVWSTSPNPTTSDSKVVDGSTVIGSYSDTMATLSSGTLYHYRAYAINAIGTNYGADTTFTTTGGGVTAYSSLMTMMGIG